MAARGATALFVPTNNALPPTKGGTELVTEARRVDVATALANEIWVIRADVAGESAGLISHGSSAIVDPKGTVVRSALPLSEDLIVSALLISAPRSPISETERARAIALALSNLRQALVS